MSYGDPTIIRGIGGVAAVSSPAAAAIVVFTGTQKNRSCVAIQAYGSAVYVKVVNRGGTAQVPSSTDYHFQIPANSTSLLPIGPAIDVYWQSAGSASGFEGI